MPRGAVACGAVLWEFQLRPACRFSWASLGWRSRPGLLCFLLFSGLRPIKIGIRKPPPWDFALSRSAFSDCAGGGRLGWGAPLGTDWAGAEQWRRCGGVLGGLKKKNLILNYNS